MVKLLQEQSQLACQEIRSMIKVIKSIILDKASIYVVQSLHYLQS